MAEENLLDFKKAADNRMADPDRRRIQARIVKNEAFYDGEGHRFIDPRPGERSEDWNSRPKPPANVTKKIINTFRAHVYGDGVNRQFVDEKNNESYQQILTDLGGLSIQQMQWHKKSWLSGMALVMPRYNERDKRFFTNIYGADMVVPFTQPEDPGRLRGLVITFNVVDDLDPNKKMHTISEVWTPDEFGVFRDDDFAKGADGKEFRGDNPFKIAGMPAEIPGGFFMGEADADKFIPDAPISDVVDMNAILLDMMSTWNEVFQYQSFNIIFYKNPNGDAVILSPRKWLTSNNIDADLKSVGVQTDLVAVGDSLGQFLGLIGDMGEVPDFTLSNNIKSEISGIALAIKFIPHTQAVNRNKTFFLPAELKLMRNFMMLADMKTSLAVTLSDEALQGTVDFSEIDLPRSLDERVAEDNHRLMHGLTSPTQLVLRDNPEMSEKQARKEVENNLKEIKELRALGGGMSAESLEAAAKLGRDRGRQDALENPPTSEL